MVLEGIKSYPDFTLAIEKRTNGKFKLYITLNQKIIKGRKIHILTYANSQNPENKYKTKNTDVPQSLYDHADVMRP